MKSNPRSFNRIVFGGGLLFVVATAVVTAVVDPFAIYRGDPYAASQKQGVLGQVRMHRAHALRQVDADVLLLGTSRTLYGLDPNDSTLLSRGERPYNAAFPNASIFESLRYLQHAHALSPVRVAVVELGLLSFDTSYSLEREGYNDERMAVSITGAAQDRPWSDLGATLLSLDAIKQSVKTLAPGGRAHLLDERGGGRQEALMMRSSRPGGIREIFIGSERFYFSRFFCLRIEDEAGKSAPMESFERLLSFARENEIDLYFYFSPVHARLLLAMERAGLWPMLGVLKKQIVERLDLDGRSHGGRAYPVVDFMTAAGVAAEHIPVNAEMQRTEHYTDASHFNRSVGHEILSRLLGGAVAEGGFGVELRPATVEANNRRLSAELERYRRAHLEDLAEVERSAKIALDDGARDGCSL